MNQVKFNEMDNDQIREVMSRQVFLEGIANPEYDSYVKKQNVTDWWKEQLWDKLSFEVIL